MSITRWALRLHKWLALVVALQVVFWVLGGFVMTLLPIDRVRGQHHAPAPRTTEIRADRVVPVSALGVAAFESAELTSGPRGTIWVLTQGERRTAFDAATGAALAPLTAEGARAAAARGYSGEGRPARARRLEVAPVESGREGPIWRVDMDDGEGTRLYLDPVTGAVASRRSDLWRFFDFWWRLHILDFDDGESINNPLIVTLAGATVAMTLAGLVLLWTRLVPARRPAERGAGARVVEAEAGSRR